MKLLTTLDIKLIFSSHLADVFGHLLGAPPHERLERLEAKLAKLVVVDATEVDKERHDALEELAHAVPCRATAKNTKCYPQNTNKRVKCTLGH